MVILMITNLTPDILGESLFKSDQQIISVWYNGKCPTLLDLHYCNFLKVRKKFILAKLDLVIKY